MIVRNFKHLAFVTLPSLFVFAVLCELFFRFVIPACEIPYTYFDPDDQILRFDTHAPREGIVTTGKFAQQRSRWRINNYGWNSAIDYVPFPQRTKPLIAIIGDSYIEGFHVNVEDHLSAVLGELVKDDYDVYSFGLSGMPLSQYLQVSRYVNRHFRPEVLVFNMIHNDFDESVRDLMDFPYFLQLTYKNGEFFEAPPDPYRPSAKRRILRKSALVRYMWLNLQMQFTLRQILDKPSKDNFNANIDVKKATDNSEIIEGATFFLIKKIREENPDKKLIFMIDGPRNDIYSGITYNSNVLWIHNLLREACAQNNSYFIDLTQAFSEKFNQEGLKFNSDHDFHWNEVGHRVAAHALYKSLIEFGLIPSLYPVSFIESATE